MRSMIAKFGISLAMLAVSVSAHATEGAAERTELLRAGPGFHFPTVGRVWREEPIEIVGCLPGLTWCDVAVEGDRGWLPASEIEILRGDRHYVLSDYYQDVVVQFENFDQVDYWGRYYPNKYFAIKRLRRINHAGFAHGGYHAGEQTYVEGHAHSRHWLATHHQDTISRHSDDYDRGDETGVEQNDYSQSGDYSEQQTDLGGNVYVGSERYRHAHIRRVRVNGRYVEQRVEPRDHRTQAGYQHVERRDHRVETSIHRNEPRDHRFEPRDHAVERLHDRPGPEAHGGEPIAHEPHVLRPVTHPMPVVHVPMDEPVRHEPAQPVKPVEPQGHGPVIPQGHAPAPQETHAAPTQPPMRRPAPVKPIVK